MFCPFPMFHIDNVQTCLVYIMSTPGSVQGCPTVWYIFLYIDLVILSVR